MNCLSKMKLADWQIDIQPVRNIMVGERHALITHTHLSRQTKLCRTHQSIQIVETRIMFIK